MTGETVLYETYKSWWAATVFAVVAMALLILSLIIFAGVIVFLYSQYIALFLLLLSLFMVILALIEHYSTRYIITSKRVLERRGLLSKHLNSVEYEKVQDVRLRKGIIAHLLDIGTLELNTAGTYGVEMVLTWIADPEKLHNMIMERVTTSP